MKIQTILLSLLLLLIPFTGCIDKADYLESEYCESGYQEHEAEGSVPSTSYSGGSLEPIKDEDCEGWKNNIALEAGDYHVIDSRYYNDSSVTLQFQSDTVVGANHSSFINYFTLTETSYHDFVGCDPFNPINVYDESTRFPNSSSDDDASWTNIRYLRHHLHFADIGAYDEPIYLVVDNWHCMDEKADGTPVGEVYVDYWVGINHNATEYFSSYYDD